MKRTPTSGGCHVPSVTRPTPASASTPRAWSAQQEAIFDWFERGHGHLLVRARAGTGKTTTILEAITRAPEVRILLAAFNKRIADELTARLANPRAVAKTLHALGFGLIRRERPYVVVDDGRGERLARQAWAIEQHEPPGRMPHQQAAAVERLAALVKNTFSELPTSADLGELVGLAGAFGIDLDDAGFEDEREAAQLALDACRAALNDDVTIDYNDMVWIPVVRGWASDAPYGLVVVDEAQDMNAVQLTLARRLGERGRLAIVGDDRQSLYQFRGADPDALDRTKAELHATELPLTTTYRCPRRVVERARVLVPDYDAAPAALDGEVAERRLGEALAMMTPGDFVLSRLNAPLARLAMRLLRAGRPVRIEGRDTIASLLRLIERWKTDDTYQMLAEVDGWHDAQRRKLQARGRLGAEKCARIDDLVETVHVLAEGTQAVVEIRDRIAKIFGDQHRGPVIVLSTVHRAKGLEAPRVFVLVDTLYCRGTRMTIEEANIHYVALTRAQQTLVLVSDD